MGNNLDIGPPYSEDPSVASELMFIVFSEFAYGDPKPFNLLFYRAPSTNTHAVEVLRRMCDGDLGDHPSFCAPQYTHDDILNVGNITK